MIRLNRDTTPISSNVIWSTWWEYIVHNSSFIPSTHITETLVCLVVLVCVDFCIALWKIAKILIIIMSNVRLFPKKRNEKKMLWYNFKFVVKNAEGDHLASNSNSHWTCYFHCCCYCNYLWLLFFLFLSPNFNRKNYPFKTLLSFWFAEQVTMLVSFDVDSCACEHITYVCEKSKVNKKTKTTIGCTVRWTTLQAKWPKMVVPIMVIAIMWHYGYLFKL